MSDVAIGNAAAPDGNFRARTVAIILVVGILGFIATLVLGAFAPDLRSGRNGGAHALSVSAVGYSGLVKLAELTGRKPEIVRNDARYATDPALLIATPEKAAAKMEKATSHGGRFATLVVLPKWNVVPDPKHPGWVRKAGAIGAWEPMGVLSPWLKLDIERRATKREPLRPINGLPGEIRFAAPADLQTMALVKDDQGEKRAKPTADDDDGADEDDESAIDNIVTSITPLLTDAAGNIVLAQVDGTQVYVLSDPDLLSNIGMADPAQARAALALLDHLQPTGEDRMMFDVTLNGFGSAQSPLKLMFQPPFLPMTLALLVALLLAAIQALASFGSPRLRERAIAFGKTALIDNSAMLVRKAGRHAMLGDRYVEAIRERAAIAFGLSPQLQGAALEEQLDTLGTAGRFAALAGAARAARTRSDVAVTAQALHRWLWEKNR